MVTITDPWILIFFIGIGIFATFLLLLILLIRRGAGRRALEHPKIPAPPEKTVEVVTEEERIALEEMLVPEQPKTMIIHSVSSDINSLAKEILRWCEETDFCSALADHLFNSLSESAVRNLLKISSSQLKKIRFGEFTIDQLTTILEYFRTNSPGTLDELASKYLPDYLQRAVKSFIRKKKIEEFSDIIGALRRNGLKSIIIISVTKDFGAWPGYVIGMTSLGWKLLRTPPLSSELLITAKYARYIETISGENLILREIVRPGEQFLVIGEINDRSRIHQAEAIIEKIAKIIQENKLREPDFINTLRRIITE
ncbi:MAG: hypothetical protein ACTSX9_09010 [Candidatus Njordarchaeales archaeon]